MKKLISAITASALTAAVATSVFAVNVFSDIDDERYDWARDNIERMADKGYITGYDDGTFRPDQNITKLECIALFARAMGSGDTANADILSKAHDTYDDLLSSYKLTWGTDELAYMLYKGALSKSDLDTYIQDVKDEPMQRYEAAIIITKAMGGEADAKAESAIVLDYSDAKAIPQNAIQYVKYVTDNEIMNGMDDNNFEPLSPVLRSQMATMLARVVDKTAYEYVKGKLLEVDTEANTIKVRNDSGKDIIYTINDDTLFKIQGVVTQVKDMIVNVDANIVLSKNVVKSVDAASNKPDVQITGRYQGSQITSSGTELRIKPNGSSDIEKYVCGEGMSVIYEGSPATLRSFAIDDLMTITVENGKVTSVTGQQRTQKISNARVEKVNIGDELTMTISHADSAYDGMTYPVADNVTVIKNNLPADMSTLYPGDSAELTLEYGEITRVNATAATRSYEGSIQSINIATEASMVVRVNGEDKEFIVPTGITIMKNNEEASLYDFRVGDIVTITTESGAITKIVSSGATASEGKISGVVTNVNTSYGFIKVLQDGTDIAETVYCKASSVTVITAKGVTKSLSDVKVGDVVEARCTMSNGAYTAKLIIIEEK